MLFRRDVLDGLATGMVSLAFRRWDRPRVRDGSRLRTAVGVLAVGHVAVIDEALITEEEARRAGYLSLESLLRELDKYRERGPVHRIELEIAGADPRVELRQRSDLSEDDFEAVAMRLERLDARSGNGPWTHRVLELIQDRPATRAAELAASAERDVLPFKTDVRKLKELGLTESLEVGYRLSPRGQAFLDRLG